MMKQKAYAYIRRKERDNPEVIVIQQDAIKRYCNQHGINEIEFFIDTGAERCVLNRDGYIKMKEKMKQDTEHKPILCVSDWSKLTRDASDAVKLVDEMEELGADCQAVNQPSAFNEKVSLLSDLPDLAEQINPDYLDSEEDEDDSFPKLLYIAPLDHDRTVLLMSDRNVYQIQNEELGELMALEFKAEYCSIGDEGRKIFMEDFDRRFPVAAIKGFMKPLPLNNHFGYDERDGKLVVNKMEMEIVKKIFQLTEDGII